MSAWQRFTFANSQVQDAISQLGDYQTFNAAFTKAETFLLSSDRCEHKELRIYGGFVKAQGENKNIPTYFTCCGGMKIANRLYVAADTGLVYQGS